MTLSPAPKVQPKRSTRASPGGLSAFCNSMFSERERLRFLEQMRAHARMLNFSIGDRVCFESGNRGLIEGILTRYNKRTVTVITDDRRQWNVSPGFLRRVAR